MLVRSLTLTGISLALMLACANQRTSGRERGSHESTSKSGGASERSTDAKSPAPTDRGHPPVDVVALDPGEARPCERMCGRVGDCLQTEEGAKPADATGIEFACLDTCVYADPLHSATSAFQACDESSACGELLGCARSRWDAVAAARRAIEIPTQFAVIRDTCETACLTLQSCNFFYRMPDDLNDVVTPDFPMVVEACTQGCRSSGEQGFAAFAECTGESSCDQFWACTARP